MSSTEKSLWKDTMTSNTHVLCWHSCFHITRLQGSPSWYESFRP